MAEKWAHKHFRSKLKDCTLVEFRWIWWVWLSSNPNGRVTESSTLSSLHSSNYRNGVGQILWLLGCQIASIYPCQVPAVISHPGPVHALIGQKMSYRISSICLSHDDSNKVCCNINETSVDFLDVTIFQGSGFSNHNILDIKVHFKDPDIHELLHKKSFHPKHSFEGIFKSLLIRFLAMCISNHV